MKIERVARLIPNLLSLARILATPFICLLLVTGRYQAALWLLALAAFSDLLDGWLARHLGWGSPMGSLLDPIADKVLVIGVAASLWWLELLPSWLLGLILGRDLVILSGAAAWRLRTGFLEGDPLLLGKVATVVVLLLLFWLPLGALLAAPWADTVSQFMTLVAAAVLLVSGLAYVVVWWRKWLLVKEKS